MPKQRITSKERRAIQVLIRSYRNTDYVVDTPRIVIRVGMKSARLDRLLEQHAAKSWAFITAWNPGSRPPSRAKNAARNRDLLALLRGRDYIVLHGIGRPRSRAWTPEASFLVLDLSVADALLLGAEFGQVAVVTGRRRGVASLRLCGAG